MSIGFLSIVGTLGVRNVGLDVALAIFLPLSALMTVLIVRSTPHEIFGHGGFSLFTPKWLPLMALLFAVCTLALALSRGMVPMLTSPDGLGHVRILEIIAEKQRASLFPFVGRSADGVLVSFAPYPTGSHLLAQLLSDLTSISSRTCFLFMGYFGSYVLYPLSLALIASCARTGVQTVRFFLLVTCLGVAWAPNLEFLQPPQIWANALGPAAAFSLLAGNATMRHRIGWLLVYACGIGVFHPNAIPLGLVVYFLVRRARLVLLLPISLVALFGMSAVILFSTDAYRFPLSWVSMNTSTSFTVLRDGILLRMIRFIAQYLLGMGAHHHLLVIIPVGALLLMALPRVRGNCRVNLLVIGAVMSLSSLTGLGLLGQLIAFSSFPWYGVPQRVVVLWQFAVIILVAQAFGGITSTNGSQTDHSRNFDPPD